MTLPSRTDTPTAAAERRLVTVLFADVVDSTALAERMDPEDWSGAIRATLALMTAPIGRYGGTVAQLIGDGLLAIFGAPAAHEDDAVRAVQAGLDMIESVLADAPRLRREFGKELGDGPHIRVGINSGLAIVEGMGGDGSRAVDALGDTVNVAARMQGAARPGSVIVTGDTWRSVAATFRGISLGGLSVKGKSEPIDAWEIAGRQDEPGSGRGVAGLTSSMVGRDEELERLLGLVTAIRAGRGRGAVLLGEPGVGKSRLLRELRAGADVRWVEARCASYRENVPYGLVGELVAACLGLPPASDPQARLAALQDRTTRLLGTAADEAFTSLAHLLNLPLAPDIAERLEPLSPQALRVHYLAAVEITLRQVAADGPTVIVLEDCHWADASSVDVVASLLQLALELPMLLLLTTRPERSAVGWHLVEAARETFGDALAELPLGPLDSAESSRLVANLLEIDSLPPRLRASILERADGNPFFMEELIRMLIERGWVVRQGDHWVGSDSIKDAEVPDTLRGLLLARIDRLADEARRTIRIASVIGRDIPVHLLETITGDVAATSRSLGLAEAAGLIRFAAAGDEPAYRFRHGLIQEAAYDSLLKADRRRLHRQVGEALEARLGDDREESAPILGLHFQRAGDVEKGVDYLQIAGRQALRRRALAEARDLLDRAATLLDDAPETPDFERRRIMVAIDRASAGALTIDFDPDIAILAEAIERAERLGDQRLLGLALARDVGTRALRGWIMGPDERRDEVERTIRIGSELGDPEILAIPLALRALELVHDGQRREAIPVLEQAVESLERFVVNEASFYAFELSWAHATLGDFAAADGAAARGQALADRSGDPKALADADIFRASILSMQGRYEEATALALRGGERAASINELMCMTMANFVVGQSELAMERNGPAIEYLTRAEDLAEQCQAVDIGRLTTVTLKVARALAGEGPGALHGLDLLIDQTRAAGDPLDEGIVLLRRAQANAMLPFGDRVAARADADAAVSIFRRLEARPLLTAAEELRQAIT
ncbi:MAG: adenylate/guanylate cyclase domain-containing protein [Candidatus Limnocylindrales bacterium]